MRLIDADELKKKECADCMYSDNDCPTMGCGVMDRIDSMPTVEAIPVERVGEMIAEATMRTINEAIPVEDVAGMLAFAHNGKLPCDLEWYECKKKPCTNGDKSCWLQVLVEGELEE